MKFSYNKTELNDIKNIFQRYLEELKSPIEMFLEIRIIESTFYMIIQNGQTAGYFAINNKDTISQFFIIKAYRKNSQKILADIKELYSIKKALLSSSDTFFLSHSLDSYKNLSLVGYMFEPVQNGIVTFINNSAIEFTRAKQNDVPLIEKETKNFFNNLNLEQNSGDNFYIGRIENNIVSVGRFGKSSLNEKYANLGMYTSEEHRLKGIGSKTVKFLIQSAYEQNYIALAACAYHNTASKRTLENGGMISNSRIIQIEF